VWTPKASTYIYSTKYKKVGVENSTFINIFDFTDSEAKITTDLKEEAPWQ
tara:strand:- start:530 stop:679 length:150 start_codon:yes stop_codon:yes gene_type:complete